MLGDVQFPSTISDKVVSCNSCGGIISFLCLIAFTDDGACGCAGGLGYFGCLEVPLLLFIVFVGCNVFIDFIVWACKVNV